MKRIIIAALGLVTLSTVVWAACPSGTRYSCYEGFNGKVICSCQ